ncbi:hypothetical protein B0H65DRAFT_459925 [Neurospora tetraspora]|uniref:Uncharacterized protein n=1 Tax=Neurospora tetraspora TaxID=94610 RepID=A0AAE0MVT4_9PEZI|nr:hypothetical protein B0H65DRAFT_459925 [Neurospora tetraspora]
MISLSALLHIIDMAPTRKNGVALLGAPGVSHSTSDDTVIEQRFLAPRISRSLDHYHCKRPSIRTSSPTSSSTRAMYFTTVRSFHAIILPVITLVVSGRPPTNAFHMNSSPTLPLYPLAAVPLGVNQLGFRAHIETKIVVVCHTSVHSPSESGKIQDTQARQGKIPVQGRAIRRWLGLEWIPLCARSGHPFDFCLLVSPFRRACRPSPDLR